MIHCKHCNKLTSNLKYCSRSCAASINNIKYPKRKPTHFCKNCNALIPASRRYCKLCKSKYLEINEANFKNKTIADIHDKAKYQISAYIRNHSRRTYRQLHPSSICENCGYDKHIEVCHKKAINDFPKDTLIAIVNHPNNLIGLCPNCHWEFDNKLLVLTETN